MDYDKMSLAELREEAKNNGIKSVSSLRKQELIILSRLFTGRRRRDFCRIFRQEFFI